MANPERGEVALTIGNRTYMLVLDMDGICKAEAVLSTPTNIVTIIEAFYGAAINSQRHVRALVWAAMQRHQPDVTLERAGELMAEAGGAEKLFKTVADLRKSTEPDKEDRPNVRPPKARRQVNGTGARATSLRVGSRSTATASGD